MRMPNYPMPNPAIRNYNKRLEIHNQLRATVANWKTMESAYVEKLDNCQEEQFDAIKQEFDAEYEKYRATVEYLWALEKSLEFPETKNEWFCGIVSEKGVGKHRISVRQWDCFSRYFEGSKDSYRTHESYCRAAGYFCTLLAINGYYQLTIVKIEKPE